MTCAGTPGRLGEPQRDDAGAGLREQRVDVPVVAAGELDDHVAAGEPAASRSADIVASVPDDTSRTCSTGVRATISSASSTSGGLGVPNDVPARRGLLHSRHHLGVRVAEQHRAPRADQVDVSLAVGVGEPRALGTHHESRRAADRPERAHRLVDPARVKP